MNRNIHEMKPRRFWTLCLAVSVISAGLIWMFRPLGPPRVTFDGLQQEAMLVDQCESCPNGDGSDRREYQLRKVDVAAWVAKQNRNSRKWVSGPLTDKKHLKALHWLGNTTELDADFQIERWITSRQTYFYLESYAEYDQKSGLQDDMHYAGMWVLDGEKCRLFYLWYRL